MVEKLGSVVPSQKSVVAVKRPVVVEQIDVGEEKSKLWLWIVIALVVIGAGAIAWLLI